MKRRFNTAGPCVAGRHYMIPAERRLPEAPDLVEQLGYFVVHAPRQTGKTTALIALTAKLTASGKYAAVFASCEAGQAAGDDFDAAEKIVLSSIRLEAESALAPELRPPPFPEAPAGFRLQTALTTFALNNPIRISNKIYRDVIVRVLASSIEGKVLAEPRCFVLADGRLDFGRVLREFAEFWREHGEVLTAGSPYYEVAPQLVLMAFLQRVVNSGGTIDREYGVGCGRIDLLVRWPYRAPDGGRALQREAIELKVWRDKKKDPLEKGLVQLDSYLEPLGLDTGVLVLFDRREGADDIEARMRFEEAVTPGGRKVTLLRA